MQLFVEKHYKNYSFEVTNALKIHPSRYCGIEINVLPLLPNKKRK